MRNAARIEEEDPQLAWREQFAAWPESTLRSFAEPTPTSWEYDERKKIARIVLAEREAERREARERRTLRIALFASVIAWIALAIAIIALVMSVLK